MVAPSRQVSSGLLALHQSKHQPVSADRRRRSTWPQDRDGNEPAMSRKLALAFAEAGFPVFPVNVFRRGERWAKVPHVAQWAQTATTDPNILSEWWLRWPLAMPGLPLERCGLVVVDADRHGEGDGVALIRAMTLPAHPIVATKSGEHHYFKQPAQPIRFMQWDGGQVLGEGRFVVGYAVPEGECPELPEVFREGRAKPAISRNLDTVVSRHCDGAVEALRKMDPRDWNGEHDAWLGLLTGCKFVGIAREDFVEWSTKDPRYADDGEIIRRKWDSVVLKHGGAFYAALKQRGIRVRSDRQQSVEDHGSRSLTLFATKPSNRDLHFQRPTIKPRIDGLLRRLHRLASEQELFNSSCWMAEMTTMPRRDALGLLEQAVKETELWAQLGRDGVRKTIERGFQHIETKRSTTLTNERRNHA
jgi:hypothetical protein